MLFHIDRVYCQRSQGLASERTAMRKPFPSEASFRNLLRLRLLGQGSQWRVEGPGAHDRQVIDSLALSYATTARNYKSTYRCTNGEATARAAAIVSAPLNSVAWPTMSRPTTNERHKHISNPHA